MSDDETVDVEPVRGREWIAGLLEQAEFVDWDRFVVATLDDGRQYVDVYGWIDREDDYKDFVWTRFWPDNDQRIMDYTTSSDEYSEELTRIWFGEEAVEDHNECRRVEHAFDIGNVIELGEQQTLVTDGGQDVADDAEVSPTEFADQNDHESERNFVGGITIGFLLSLLFLFGFVDSLGIAIGVIIVSAMVSVVVMGYLSYLDGVFG